MMIAAKDPREKDKKEEGEQKGQGIPASPGQSREREINNPPLIDPGENSGPGENQPPSTKP